MAHFNSGRQPDIFHGSCIICQWDRATTGDEARVENFAQKQENIPSLGQHWLLPSVKTKGNGLRDDCEKGKTLIQSAVMVRPHQALPNI